MVTRERLKRESLYLIELEKLESLDLDHISEIKIVTRKNGIKKVYKICFPFSSGSLNLKEGIFQQFAYDIEKSVKEMIQYLKFSLGLK